MLNKRRTYMLQDVLTYLFVINSPQPPTEPNLVFKAASRFLLRRILPWTLAGDHTNTSATLLRRVGGTAPQAAE